MLQALQHRYACLLPALCVAVWQVSILGICDHAESKQRRIMGRHGCSDRLSRRAARKASVAALQPLLELRLDRSMPICQGGRLIGSQRDSQSGEERVGRQLSLWRGLMHGWILVLVRGRQMAQLCASVPSASAAQQRHNSSRNARAAGAPPVPVEPGAFAQLTIWKLPQFAPVSGTSRSTARSALPQHRRLLFPTSDQSSAVS